MSPGRVAKREVASACHLTKPLMQKRKLAAPQTKLNSG